MFKNYLYLIIIAQNPAVSTTSLLPYLPYPLIFLIYGLPEVMSFFVGALSGGIISAGVVRGDVRKKHFKMIAYDCLALIGISICLLFAAAILEVYIADLLI